MKKYSLCGLFLGLIFLLGGLLLPLLCINREHALIGVIDPLSFWFWLSASLAGLPLVLTLIGLSLTLSAGFCLVFPKIVRDHCTPRTTAISVALSATAALGLVCFMMWFATAVFADWSRYPIAHSVSVVLGLVCLVVFILLLYWYFVCRHHTRSMIGLILDVVTCFLYAPSFFFLFLYVQQFLR